jgi:hypothetical protein
VAISIQCAACGKRYQAADHMSGRRVRCKHCGTTFQLPAEPTSDEPFERAPDEREAPTAGMLADPALLDLAPAAVEDPPPRAPGPAPMHRRPHGKHRPPRVPSGKRRQPPPRASATPFDEPASAFGAEGDDVEAVFEEAFQQYAPARGNTPSSSPAAGCSTDTSRSSSWCSASRGWHTSRSATTRASRTGSRPSG